MFTLPALFSLSATFSFLLFRHSRYFPPSRSNSHSIVFPPPARSRRAAFSFYTSSFSLFLSLSEASRKATTADRETEQKREENVGEEQKKESDEGVVVVVEGTSRFSVSLFAASIPNRSLSLFWYLIHPHHDVVPPSVGSMAPSLRYGALPWVQGRSHFSQDLGTVLKDPIAALFSRIRVLIQMLLETDFRELHF